MNMWLAIVCIVAIVLLFIIIIVGLIIHYKKYKINMEDNNKERIAKEKLNNTLIENNLIKKNCDPIPFGNTSYSSGGQENISNSDINDAAKNVIDIASIASTAFKKRSKE